jgi:hypothetical protein
MVATNIINACWYVHINQIGMCRFTSTCTCAILGRHEQLPTYDGNYSWLKDTCIPSSFNFTGDCRKTTWFKSWTMQPCDFGTRLLTLPLVYYRLTNSAPEQKPPLKWKSILQKNIFGPIYLFYTQTMHIKSIVHNSLAMTSLKTLHIPWRDSNPGLLFLRQMRSLLRHSPWTVKFNNYAHPVNVLKSEIRREPKFNL